MPNMLVVDDEESICFSMSEYFALHGYEVDSAQERSEAEALMSQKKYSVVIQDLCLGGINKTEGIEIIDYVHRQYPETKIVVLTAYGAPELEAEARRCGASAFLHKPKPLSDVAQVIYGMVPANA